MIFIYFYYQFNFKVVTSNNRSNIVLLTKYYYYSKINFVKYFTINYLKVTTTIIQSFLHINEEFIINF